MSERRGVGAREGAGARERDGESGRERGPDAERVRARAVDGEEVAARGELRAGSRWLLYACEMRGEAAKRRAQGSSGSIDARGGGQRQASRVRSDAPLLQHQAGKGLVQVLLLLRRRRRACSNWCAGKCGVWKSSSEERGKVRAAGATREERRGKREAGAAARRPHAALLLWRRCRVYLGGRIRWCR